MPDEKLKLLVLASTFPRWSGDTEPAFVYELSRRLAREFDVTALVPHAPCAATHEQMENIRVIRFRYAPEQLQRLAYDGGILANLRYRRWTVFLVPFFVLAELFAIIRILRRDRPHVIHAHWIIPQALLARLARTLSGVPVRILATSHGGDLYALKGWLGHKLKRFALQGADAITTVSTAMREHAETTLQPAAGIQVIPMGTDLRTLFSQPASDVDRPAGSILFVGRLVEKKGIAYLIEAFRMIACDQVAARLDIVGDGPLRESLAAQVDDAGLAEKVTFHGSIPPNEVARIMQRSEILVMPSVVGADGDQEGFGLVMVEAMGCGCAVVASDLPAIRDIVIDEKTGLLAGPGDSKQLANRIRRVLDDDSLREALQENGRKHAVDNFDWEGINERYGKLIASLRAGE